MMAMTQMAMVSATAPQPRDLSEAEIDRCIADIGILGYSKIEGFLPPDALADQQARLHRQVEAHRGAAYPGYSEFRPEDEQVFNLQNKEKAFLDPLGAPGLERILMAFLSDPHYPALPADAPNYILGEYIARASGTPLKLHIDAWMAAPGPATWMMQLAIALDDRTEANGCSLVVPGSHRSGSLSERDYKGTTPLPMKAGDAALWDSRLWHGALPNTSGRQAWSLIATLQRWWVKPRFDTTASLPGEIYDQLSDRQKALLGFCCRPPRDEFTGTNTRQGYEALPKRLG